MEEMLKEYRDAIKIYLIVFFFGDMNLIFFFRINPNMGFYGCGCEEPIRSMAVDNWLNS
jgi:hypothetical protein